MDTSNEISQLKTAGIIECRTRHFEDFAAVYILLAGAKQCSLAVVALDPRGQITDRCFIEDLCVDPEEGIAMLTALYDGGVTPCTARDVLEDMIGV